MVLLNVLITVNQHVTILYMDILLYVWVTMVTDLDTSKCKVYKPLLYMHTVTQPGCKKV